VDDLTRVPGTPIVYKGLPTPPTKKTPKKRKRIVDQTVFDFVNVDLLDRSRNARNASLYR
jgi:hypothetical protein